MRMRKLSKKSVSATSPPSSSSSSSSSSLSSSTFHSSSVITSHSISASSTDSSPSSSSAPSSSSSSSIRCEGLDLLVKAIHHISGGSVVGAPYIQRKRVVTRRRRADYLRFNQFFVTDHLLKETVEMKREEREDGGGSGPKSKKQTRRVMALPSKYQDSVLQPWSLRGGQQRSITKINH